MDVYKAGGTLIAVAVRCAALVALDISFLDDLGECEGTV